MDLLSSKVPRALEIKARLFGFELADLLIIFLYLSVTNLFLGGTWLKIPVVWLGTILLAALFHFAKRGKPEKHLEHSIQFLTQPRVYSAAQADVTAPAYNSVVKEDRSDV